MSRARRVKTRTQPCTPEHAHKRLADARRFLELAGEMQTLSTYGHVIDELDEAPRAPAEDAIRVTRNGSRVSGVSRPSEGRE
jgi:hypothetical protein